MNYTPGAQRVFANFSSALSRTNTASPTSLLPPREHLIFFSSFPSVGQIVGWNLMFKWKRYGERRRNRIVDSLVVDSQ